MDLKSLRGVSEKRLKDLEKLNIHSVEALVNHFPRGYLDMRKRVSVREVLHGDMALLCARLVKVEPVRYTGRVKYLRAWLEEEGDTFSAVWFNMPYLANRLKAGEYLFYGRIQNKFGQPSIVNPTFEPLTNPVKLKGIVPVYPLKGSLTQKIMRDLIRDALSRLEIETVVPPFLQKKYALSPLRAAYRTVHDPESEKALKEASERIALEEYFTLVSAFRLIKGGRNEARLNEYSVTERDVAAFEERFPFRFTKGQQAAVRAIYENLKSPLTMNRLLQGDVGSGKTAVALTGIFMAVKSGYQAAYLSPTEVLAEQNYEILKRTFPEYRVGYLAGGSSAREKRAVKEALARGEIDILAGTHAVLQADVRFLSLAFCVCDEQHRFGVSQRNVLSEKGASPDMLVMSATPIPRTLSLVVYGDLDVTTIPDKPAARQEISTSVIRRSRYDDMLSYIEREAKAGKQAYFVCAKIDDDEGEVTSVSELYEELKGKMPFTRFAMLHGRMKDAEKTQIMADFKAKKYDCLVSTTVIEVGVDVPSATIMVIMNAERFGLSQLHQLRGRVGRGSEKSYCFLLVGTESETSAERLQIFKSTNDGFRLAEKDLELRGGGDFFGTRQSGKFLSDIKNLKYSTDVIYLAKKLCDEAFEQRLGYDKIRAAAMKKYESLKDIVLN